MTPRMGFMLPNTEWVAWTSDDIAAIMDLKPTVILIPLYAKGEALTAVRLAEIVSLRAQLPNCTFLWRMMADKIPLIDPNTWATECASRLSPVQAAFPGELIHVIPWNEWNIEGGGENWPAYAGWIGTFTLAFKTPCILHLPALSPIGNYKAGWAYLAASGTYKYFNALDVHVYPGSIGDDSALAAVASPVQAANAVWITEFNGILPSVLAQGSGVAQGAIWFILRGTPDQAQYNLMPSTNSAYQDMKRVLTVTSLILPPRVTWARGSDFSDNNGQLNYDLTFPCLDFGVFEANDGYYVNTSFGPNWYHAGQMGLTRVANCYMELHNLSGANNANELLDILTKNGVNSGDNVIFDVEDPLVPAGAGLAAGVINAIQTVQAHLKLSKIRMYSGPAYMADHGLMDNAILEAGGEFIAWWREDTPPPNPWEMWQYGSGVLPGVIGIVDYDLYQGTVAQLRATGLP